MVILCLIKVITNLCEESCKIVYKIISHPETFGKFENKFPIILGLEQSIENVTFNLVLTNI